jgi:hypothetical protein
MIKGEEALDGHSLGGQGLSGDVPFPASFVFQFASASLLLLVSLLALWQLFVRESLSAG